MSDSELKCKHCGGPAVPSNAEYETAIYTKYPDACYLELIERSPCGSSCEFYMGQVFGNQYRITRLKCDYFLNDYIRITDYGRSNVDAELLDIINRWQSK